ATATVGAVVAAETRRRGEGCRSKVTPHSPPPATPTGPGELKPCAWRAKRHRLYRVLGCLWRPSGSCSRTRRCPRGGGGVTG
ncbi:unnamed protein product, partial [Ectocarpus sp. 12 AP-2014]